MNRKETTTLLTEILIHDRLLDRKYYAKEVTLDSYTTHSTRIDVMQFIPNGVIYTSDIEKGIFICYEIKSCLDDIYSGNGLNFIGEKNYIVTTMDTYKELQPKLIDGTFDEFMEKKHNNKHPNFGVMVAVPNNIDCRKTSDIHSEYENPTPFDASTNWKLYEIYHCREGARTRSTTELLFCMLRAKHNNSNVS